MIGGDLNAQKILFSHWLIWRWSLLNRNYCFKKLEMLVCNNFIKRNEKLQQNILVNLRQYIMF